MLVKLPPDIIKPEEQAKNDMLWQLVISRCGERRWSRHASRYKVCANKNIEQSSLRLVRLSLAQGYLVSCSTCNDIDNLFNQQPALGLLSIPKVTLPQISTRLGYITLRCELRLPVASRFQETVHIYLISKANLLVTSETIGSPIY